MNVVDNTRDHRFELTVDSELAVSGYRLSGNVITFTHTGRGTYRSNLRTLMLQAAAARARGAALDIAELAGGTPARAHVARAFYDTSSPYEPLDAADGVFVEQLIARANAVSDVEISAHGSVALLPVYHSAPWEQNQIVLFENVICRS